MAVNQILKCLQAISIYSLLLLFRIILLRSPLLVINLFIDLDRPRSSGLIGYKHEYLQYCLIMYMYRNFPLLGAYAYSSTGRKCALMFETMLNNE